MTRLFIWAVFKRSCSIFSFTYDQPIFFWWFFGEKGGQEYFFVSIIFDIPGHLRLIREIRREIFGLSSAIMQKICYFQLELKNERVVSENGIQDLEKMTTS